MRVNDQTMSLELRQELAGILPKMFHFNILGDFTFQVLVETNEF